MGRSVGRECGGWGGVVVGHTAGGECGCALEVMPGDARKACGRTGVIAPIRARRVSRDARIGIKGGPSGRCPFSLLGSPPGRLCWGRMLEAERPLLVASSGVGGGRIFRAPRVLVVGSANLAHA